METAKTILRVEDLCVDFATPQGPVTAVDGLSFAVEAGRTLGIVGESGCGKSVTAMSLLRLLPQPMARIRRGRILFMGQDLLQYDMKRMQDIRGRDISCIFQEPMSALNPVMRLGDQFKEVMTVHGYTDDNAQRRAIELFEQVGISSPAERLRQYPHQLSGGMRQRAMIAMALACKPKILIADEPTTALDVTIQSQILHLLKQLQRDYGLAMIFISHDMSVVAAMADDVAVMYAGTIVEQAPAEQFFARQHHPYSTALLAALPQSGYKAKTPLPSIKGQVPSLNAMPKGCRFANRCRFKTEVCTVASPQLENYSDVGRVACTRWRELEREVSHG